MTKNGSNSPSTLSTSAAMVRRPITRRAVILLIVMTLIAVFGYVSTGWYAQKSLDRIAQRTLVERVQKVRNVIKDQEEVLAKHAQDYGYWNDMYDYVSNPDTSWERENLVWMAQSFSLDMLVILDMQGRVVYSWGKYLNLKQGDTLHDDSFTHSLKNKPIFYGTWDNRGAYFMCAGSGIFGELEHGAFRSPAGVVIVGNHISESYLGQIGELTGEKLDLFSLTGRNITDPSSHDLNSNSEISSYSGSLVLRSVDDHPAAFLRVITQFPALQFAQSFSYLSVGMLMALGLFWIAAISIAFRQWVIRPLSLLRKGLAQCEHGITVDWSSLLRSEDELQHLAIAFGTVSKALVESERNLRCIVEDAADAVLVVDRTGRIETANQKAYAYMMAGSEDILNLRVSDVLIQEYVSYFEQVLSDLRNKGKSYTEISMISSDGKEHECEINAIAMQDGRFFVGIRDIADRKRTERALKRRAHIEESVYSLSSRFVGNVDFNSAITQTLCDLSSLTWADQAFLFQFNDDLSEASSTWNWTHTGAECDHDVLKHIPMNAGSWWMQQLQNNEIVFFLDLDDLPAAAKQDDLIFQPRGIASALVIPLFNSDLKLSGFISLDNVAEIARWSEDDTNILRIAAETIGNAMERNLTELALNRRLQIEEVVFDLSSRFVDVSDLDDAIRRTLRDISLLCGSGRSYLFLFNDDGSRMTNTHEWVAEGVETHLDTWQDSSVDALPWATSVFKSGQNLHVPDVTKLPPEGAVERELLINRGISSLLCLPLHIGGKVAGFVGIDNVLGTNEWSDDDVAILRVASEIIGSALNRKQVEQALRESEIKHRTVITNLKEVVFQIDVQGQWTFLNPAWMEITGFSVEESLGASYLNFVHPEDRDNSIARFNSLLDSAREYLRSEVRYLTKAGGYRWIEVFARLNFDDLGNRCGIMGTLNDVTERHLMEDELRRSEKRFRIVVETAPIAVIISRVADGQVLYSNENARSLFGVSIEDASEMKTTDFFVHAEDRDWVVESVHKYGGFSNYETQVHKYDGSPLWVSDSTQLISFDGEEAIFSGILDITERKQAEQALQENELYLRMIRDFLSVGIMVIDAETHEIVDVNPAAIKLIGASKSRIVGSICHNFVCPADKGRCPISDLHQPVDNAEKILVTADGRKIPIVKSVASIVLNGRKCLLESLVDISERKEAEVELRRAKELAETANRTKSEFLANMSHEIRTPMNAIIGFASLLDESVTDEKEKEFSEAILTSGKSLLTLINDILDLSKIEAGALELQLRPISPLSLFKEVQRIYSLRARSKGLEFMLDVEDGLPPALMLDQIRLRQILVNLVGNAIKFTDHGYIKIEVVAEPIGNDGKSVDLIIRVEDTGIGIPEVNRSEIFKAFVQKNWLTDRHFGGTGLGLAITQRLVEIMGGKISVTSELGEGSVFMVELHSVQVVTSDMEEETTIAQVEEEAPNFSRSTVLIVEDKPLNRQLIREILRETNLNIVEAENGLIGLEKAAELHPSLILMDMRMPVLDGYEATRRLKSDAALKDIPLVAVTASVMQKDRDKIQELGCNAFLSKPVDKSELFDILRRYLPMATTADLDEMTGDSTSGCDSETESRAETYSVQMAALARELSETMTATWQNIRETMFLDDVKSFAASVRQLAVNYGSKEATTWGQRLERESELFQIEKLMKTLDDFPSLVESIKLSSEHRAPNPSTSGTDQYKA